MSFRPTSVERMTPLSWCDIACMRVRSISIGLTAIAAMTRAADPAIKGAYESLTRPTIGLL